MLPTASNPDSDFWLCGEQASQEIGFSNWKWIQALSMASPALAAVVPCHVLAEVISASQGAQKLCVFSPVCLLSLFYRSRLNLQLTIPVVPQALILLVNDF